MKKEDILKALSFVQEPDLGSDLVSLGMIQDITIDDNQVYFNLELTTPACPMKEMMKSACENAIKLMVNAEAIIHIRFITKTSSGRKDQGVLLKGVKNIIAVVSGKGGVGKSTVAANLALALSKKGAVVGLMDADIYGPSIPMMFGIRGKRPFMKDDNGKSYIIPIEKFGIRLMSIGLLIDEKDAVVWRGPMVSSAIKQFISDVDWGVLDYLIIDMPPGTGDIHLTLIQSVPLTGVVVVSTPQAIALADAKKAIAMFAQTQIKVPILGLVENMAYFMPPLSSTKYYIFGKDGGKNLAEEFDIPLLGQLPLIESIREGGDSGIPALLHDDQNQLSLFYAFADTTIREISKRNAQH